MGGPNFFPYPSRVSISPPDSDEQANWCDSPPLSSPTGGTGISVVSSGGYNSSVTALSEDNERLRRSNNMLMSELAHMRKLYNDIIYFVQNHVKPVAPSNSYPSSLVICNSSPSSATPINTSMVQKPLNQFIGYHQSSPKDAVQLQNLSSFNSTSTTSHSTLTILEEPNSRTKLFGVPLQSKKRLHPEYASSTTNMETNKARLVLEKDDLGPIPAVLVAGNYILEQSTSFTIHVRPLLNSHGLVCVGGRFPASSQLCDSSSSSGFVLHWSWNKVATGRLLKKWHAHYRALTCSVYCDDQSLLISGAEGGCVRVWSLVMKQDTSMIISLLPRIGLARGIL
ncbi:hypothetical protein F0562_027656 [Nyssa sinensis]|uniref:Uncharacterized protein n=1 Tax=Nyssa sinensis TaxID=561372 RepID=A0A5J5B5F6_9ASTE|nr:hypothetical protein F0562_027656 [Nyssa sinensis]